MKKVKEQYANATFLVAADKAALPLVMGRADEFELKDLMGPQDKNILVHAGIVYALPFSFHGLINILPDLFEAIDDARKPVSLLEDGRYFKGLWKIQRPVVNLVGGHARFSKTCDCAFGVPAACGKPSVPTFIIEVGIRNETECQMMIQAVCWFSISQVQYVLLIKVYDDETNIIRTRILLLQRDEARLADWRTEYAGRKPIALYMLYAHSPSYLQSLFPVRILNDRIQPFAGPIQPFEIALDPFLLTGRNQMLAGIAPMRVDLTKMIMGIGEFWRSGSGSAMLRDVQPLFREIQPATELDENQIDD